MKIDHLGPATPPAHARQVSIPMRDGVVLAADVYLPTGTGARWSAVLVRLPYDKNGVYCFMDEIAAYITERGYAAVIQDVRGKFHSNGETLFGVHEADDGYDTIDWVSHQDWSDGAVVMWGDSYFGLTQLAAASAHHPALRAIAPRLTGTRLGQQMENPDGTPMVDTTTRRVYYATMYVDRDAYDWPVDWTRRPLADTFEDFFGELGRRSPSYDREIERPGALRGTTIDKLLAAPAIPVLFTVGQYDNCAVWSWPDISALSNDAEWSARLHLRFEAIDHENYRRADAPITAESDHAVSADARARMLPRILDPALDFFDDCLGRDGATATPRVRYEIVGLGWRDAERWPPRETQSWVLHAQAGAEPGRARLAEDPPSSTGHLRWESDGVDLVPSISDDPFALVLGAHDLAAAASRADVATAVTDPLDHDIVLAGRVELRGSVTASTPSADVFARLLDIAPDGEASLIARGSVHLAMPGEGTRFHIDLLYVARLVHTGHRLMLHLAGTDYPEHIFNTGDGSDPWRAKGILPVTTTLQLGGANGLALRLGLLPA